MDTNVNSCRKTLLLRWKESTQCYECTQCSVCKRTCLHLPLRVRVPCYVRSHETVTLTSKRNWKPWKPWKPCPVASDLEIERYILTIKPTRCTNFSNLFWNETLNVSDSSSVHHQEFFTVRTAIVYVKQVCRQLASRIRMFHPDPARTCMTCMT